MINSSIIPLYPSISGRPLNWIKESLLLKKRIFSLPRYKLQIQAAENYIILQTELNLST